MAADIRILVSDKISDEGMTILRSEGFEVVERPDITPEELVAEIANFDGLVIRSRTNVTAEVLANAKRLKVVGRAGVGLDNVDIPTATRMGVIVMNTPGGNTMSTAEHSFAMIMSIARSIPQADASMVTGRWDKKKYVGVELNGKTLGVIGFGRIGQEVTKRALAFNMRVVAYDPFMNPEVVKRLGITQGTVEDVCRAADFITVHTPLNDQTRGIISADMIAIMKPSVRIINCARGGIVDETALLDGLKSGKVAGAALDVFVEEPLPADSPFRTLESVICTPHLGAATSEAQEGVAKEVAQQIVDCLSGRMIINAVNAPSVDPAILNTIKPYLDLAQRMGKFMSQFVSRPVKKLHIYYSGTVTDSPTAPITKAAVMGFLEPVVEFSVNFVNAGYVAEERGIEVVEEKSSRLYDFSNLITLEVTTDDGKTTWIGGSVLHGKMARIVGINDKFMDVVPAGNLVVIENRDVPGIVGGVGVVLGHNKINIAQMTWGRTGTGGGEAITVINVDQEVTDTVMNELRALPNVISARIIKI